MNVAYVLAENQCRVKMKMRRFQTGSGITAIYLLTFVAKYTRKQGGTIFNSSKGKATGQ
jgi:hypothetical protein